MQLCSAGLLRGHVLAALRPGRRPERGRTWAGQVPVRMLSPFLIERPWKKYASTLRTGT